MLPEPAHLGRRPDQPCYRLAGADHHDGGTIAMADTNVPAGGSPGKTTRHLSAADLARRRHAEMIESLWRISVGIEALHQSSERQTKVLAGLDARLDSILRWLIQAWQAASGQGMARGGSDHG
jgi:hypothetical protein